MTTLQLKDNWASTDAGAAVTLGFGPDSETKFWLKRNMGPFLLAPLELVDPVPDSELGSAAVGVAASDDSHRKMIKAPRMVKLKIVGTIKITTIT